MDAHAAVGGAMSSVPGPLRNHHGWRRGLTTPLGSYYIQPGSNWRPSACWADVIATRPWMLMTWRTGDSFKLVAESIGREAGMYTELERAHGVRASYKPPMLVTRVRVPVCACFQALLCRWCLFVCFVRATIADYVERCVYHYGRRC